jgi:hypothetical protein
MKTELSPMSFWYHDLCSCLHNLIASQLLYYGHDPILTLGAVWDFYYDAAQLRKEEYYYSVRNNDPIATIAPYHPLRGAWHAPREETSWDEVRACVAAGVPAIVAVDNFFLPYRPAYQDVHAGHLIAVYGFDDASDQAYILDSSPPAFKGPFDRRQLQLARGAQNPAHDRDYFFSGSPAAHRWLKIEADSAAFPALTRAWVAETLLSNLQRFHAPGDGAGLSGLAGIERYLETIVARIASGQGDSATDELYLVGWAAQASTALHADFLQAVGQRVQWPRLVELGRHVDMLAHHWSTLRMLGAHGRENLAQVGDRIQERTSRLLADQRQALEQLDRAIRAI